MPHSITRRRFLTVGAAAAGGLALGVRPQRVFAMNDQPRPRVAAIVTVLRPRSHAHVILENFFQPYLFRGKVVEPACDVASLYVDQFPDNDMSRDVSKQYGVPMFDSIDKALTRGGDTLAVDAVLIIGEHGDYPVNEKGQTEYPRKAFFDAVVDVFKKSGRSVPVFNDKHLSHRWDWAKEMVDTARAMKFPLMAGSSVPLAERRPSLQLDPGSAIEQAVSIHSGPLEAYGYHAIETMQSVVEARKGGETGVAAVQYLKGEPLWQAARDGKWSPALAATAMACELGPDDRIAYAMTHDGKDPRGNALDIDAILVTYRDGLRGIALTGTRNSNTRWSFACRTAADDGAPVVHATMLYSQLWENRCLFMSLAHAIQRFFVTGRPPYPVERTLLSTGIIAAAMDSHFAKGKAVDTPHLDVSYKAVDFEASRENGASWEILTPDSVEPEGFAHLKLEG